MENEERHEHFLRLKRVLQKIKIVYLFRDNEVLAKNKVSKKQ